MSSLTSDMQSIHPTVFVTADAVTIVMQIAGAALIGVSESNLADGTVPPVTPAQANDILIAGLSVQVFAFSIYLSMLALLLYRLKATGGVGGHDLGRRPKMLLTILAISSISVYVRTIFRLTESASGVGSAASHNQALFTALETVPIMLVVLLWTVFPLSWMLTGSLM